MIKMIEAFNNGLQPSYGEALAWQAGMYLHYVDSVSAATLGRYNQIPDDAYIKVVEALARTHLKRSKRVTRAEYQAGANFSSSPVTALGTHTD